MRWMVVGRILTWGAALFLPSACGGGDPGPGPEPIGPITIRNGDVTLAAILDVPTTPGPHPVMVFVPGSGRGTKESDQAAVDLALPRGIAVVRYDKRGLGQSTGTFEEITVGGANSERVLDVRASDVRAIVEYLATRSDIRADRIFLWGTSQGAWVAPLVATRTSKVAFVINVSGGGSPVGTSDYYDGLAAAEPTASIEDLTARLDAFAGPFGYDPRPTLAAVNVPILWLFGGLDRSNPSLYDIAQVERIKQLNGKDFTVELFPRMNHEMIDVDTNQIPADLMPKVATFVAARFGQP